MRTLLTVIVFAASALAGPFASAQGAGPAYKCGGVGDAEQRAFKAAAAQHDALVTFSENSGAYVAGVEFRVLGADGRAVLQGRCDGPLMLLDVPGTGRYEIEAAYNGKAQRKPLAVGGKPAQVGFSWTPG